MTDAMPHSRWLTRFVIWIVVSYGVALIVIEAATSQQFVRHFVTDISGPVPFYAVNTTLSVFLLWTTALLFAICIYCERSSGQPAGNLFLISQVVLFAYLGFDDRFKVHENLAHWLNIGDHYILASIGAAELLILATLGRWHVDGTRAGRWLLAAAVLFAGMLFVDACSPDDLRMRLSVEDTLKTWACFCFAMYGWEILKTYLASISDLRSCEGGERDHIDSDGDVADSARFETPAGALHS